MTDDMDCGLTVTKTSLQSCGGVIVTDVDGNFIERYGCEVHLFDKGVCAWQQAMYDEQKARR